MTISRCGLWRIILTQTSLSFLILPLLLFFSPPFIRPPLSPQHLSSYSLFVLISQPNKQAVKVKTKLRSFIVWTTAELHRLCGCSLLLIAHREEHGSSPQVRSTQKRQAEAGTQWVIHDMVDVLSEQATKRPQSGRSVHSLRVTMYCFSIDAQKYQSSPFFQLF